MKVALFYMPFGAVEYPHLGTGLLKACLRREGHECDVRNEALKFARFVGHDTYSYIEGHASPMLLGERVFARQLNPGIPDLDRFYREIVRPAVRGLDNRLVFSREAYLQWSRLMGEAETRAREWMAAAVADPRLADYDVFGFSTSYEQNTASLAMAKELKARYPGTPVLFGGSNCMGSLGLGLLRAFPFIDHVFTGEAELSLVQFLRWCEDPAKHPRPTRGVISRESLTRGDYDLDPEQVLDLDALPIPDYDDYFEELRKAGDWRKHFFGLAVEGSRGCWKAHGSHCTFCGLNGNQNRYRAKGATRFVEELEHLCDRHHARYVVTNDNILSPGLLSHAFPRLRERRPYTAMWQQIRVGLSRSDLELLRDSGARYVGAGIESLSTPLLGMMRKGLPSRDATALENVHLLRMATELGIDLTWQVLCGLPGETADQYEEMAELMRHLHHLVPPKQMARISVERHSPLYTEAESFGLDLEPSKAYRFVYDLPRDLVAGFASCYQDRNEYGDRMVSMGTPSYVDPVLQEIRRWQESWSSSELEFVDEGRELVVRDGRDGHESDSRYSGPARAVVEATMTPSSRRSIQEDVVRALPTTTEAAIDRALEELTERHHIVEESGQYLFLAVDHDARRAPPSRDEDNFFLRAARENRRYEYDL